MTEPITDEQLDVDFAKFWEELHPTLRNALGRIAARHIYGSGWYDGGLATAAILRNGPTGAKPQEPRPLSAAPVGPATGGVVDPKPIPAPGCCGGVL